MNRKKLLCVLLAAVMLLGLISCGKKDAADTDPNLMKLGSYELRYKSACIMEDYDGNDAVVLTLDFTNNTKMSDTYLLSIIETATQNGQELETATIYLSEDSFDTVIDSQYTEIAPGETIEIKSAFVMADAANDIEVTFEELFGDDKGTITVDPVDLVRETPGGSTEKPVDSGMEQPADGGASDTLLDWWNGDWYGWWTIYGCSDGYVDYEDQWWDAGATIDISSDYTGQLTLWDELRDKSSPLAEVGVTLSEDGTTEYGTLISEDGYFMDVAMEEWGWTIDPSMTEYPDMINIWGYYDNGTDYFSYDIYLRPWGTYWDDMYEEDLPYYYDSWYLPLIEAGEPMPNVIGEGTLDTGATAAASGDIPGGDGIITDEQVYKGWVYMSEVAKDIFNTTYEELVDYFGVEGQFVEESYSDVYEANMRYYKWVSSENPNNFLYVNFLEEEPGVYEISAFNTSGISGSEAVEQYLDIVKAEAAEADRAAAANAVMEDFSMEVKDPITDNVIRISTVLPESGWSSKKDIIVENEDPDAFGAGTITFKLRESMEKLESSKDSYKNFQEIEDRVIGGITFKGRTYEYIGYDWIEYVAQIDDGRFLSVGLTDLDCFPGTMPDIILNSMQFQ